MISHLSGRHDRERRCSREFTVIFTAPPGNPEAIQQGSVFHMASARVLDVGNCDPDHGMISAMLRQHFDVVIDRVMFVHEAVERMRANKYAIVLLNRLIFADDSPGDALLKQSKSDPQLAATPIMMISNFAEAQASAVALGAVPGFGKAQVTAPQTRELLSQYLPTK
jgi:CheY-like chemotaxis protein